MSEAIKTGRRSWHRRLESWYGRVVMPTAAGLPNWKVVVWYPAILVVAFAVLVALHLSGTSSGAHWLTLGTGIDPRLVAGVPRTIRSDEWLVQQGWVVSQSHRGYPTINPMFPGGTDMTVLNQLPAWNWSSAFRPDVLGYLFFGLDAGVAWQWWLPALAIMSGAYLLLVAVLPRRPVAAALISSALFFTPFVQWWYTSTNLWPIAWPLLAMAAVVWVLTDRRLWVRVVWSAVAGYGAVTLAMSLYFPFIYPGVLVFLAFAIGYFLRVHSRGTPFGVMLRRAVPLFTAGVAAAVVTGLWLYDNLSTIRAISSTVYPGQRSLATGTIFAYDPGLIGLIGAPWNQALKQQDLVPNALGSNSSESSTVLLVFVFVLPALVWIAARSLRRGVETEWLVIAILACFAFIAAYLFIPGWDRLADVLQVARVPPNRFRVAFVVVLPVSVLMVVDYIERHRSRWNIALGLVSGAVALGLTAYAWHDLRSTDPAVLAEARFWKIIAIAGAVAVVVLFLRRGVIFAAALILFASVLMGWGINPLYRGVYDLTLTQAGRTLQSINSTAPGAWVGVGSAEVMAIVDESDVRSYSGVQDYPSLKMWHAIDPTGKYKEEWNRLGHVSWYFAPGPLKISNPQSDVIFISLDTCGAFAQDHVKYILSDTSAPPGSCVEQRAQVQQGQTSLHFYQVVPAS